MSAPADPQTREEWADALLAAHAFLRIHAAVCYGLLTGGPTINADRCKEIIEQAHARGVTDPSDEAITQAGLQICATDWSQA